MNKSSRAKVWKETWFQEDSSSGLKAKVKAKFFLSSYIQEWFCVNKNLFTSMKSLRQCVVVKKNLVPVNQNPFISTILNYKTKNLNIKFSRAMHQLIVELLYPKNKSFLRILNFNKIWLSSCGLIVSEGPSWPAIVSSFAGAARTKLTDRMTKNNACKNKLRKCKWS